jgi:hypothetical protein
MMSLAVFKALYANGKKGAFKTEYDKQDATRYWLKHKINLLDLTAMLRTASFEERWVIAELMSVAERKVTHWERHRNFDMQRALTVFSAVKHANKRAA